MGAPLAYLDWFVKWYVELIEEILQYAPSKPGAPSHRDANKHWQQAVALYQKMDTDLNALIDLCKQILDFQGADDYLHDWIKRLTAAMAARKQ